MMGVSDVELSRESAKKRHLSCLANCSDFILLAYSFEFLYSRLFFRESIC